MVSALVTLSARDADIAFALLAYIPAVVFWGLDGYFLSAERSYRAHYDRVRRRDPVEIDFSMDTSDFNRGVGSWAEATFSKTLWPFHGSLILAVIVVMFTQL